MKRWKVYNDICRMSFASVLKIGNIGIVSNFKSSVLFQSRHVKTFISKYLRKETLRNRVLLLFWDSAS